MSNKDVPGWLEALPLAPKPWKPDPSFEQLQVEKFLRPNYNWARTPRWRSFFGLSTILFAVAISLLYVLLFGRAHEDGMIPPFMFFIPILIAPLVSLLDQATQGLFRLKLNMLEADRIRTRLEAQEAKTWILSPLIVVIALLVARTHADTNMKIFYALVAVFISNALIPYGVACWKLRKIDTAMSKNSLGSEGTAT